MRDLKRPNAKQPAYLQLKDEPLEVFTPLKQQIRTKNGKRIREEVPYIHDLLFVKGSQQEVEAILQRIPTLQFRFLRGGFRKPMIVRDADMERFIHAISVSEFPQYYLPEEITPAMYGRTIRVVGGNLDGYQGTLITTRGSKTKRLLVELKDCIAVAVEINADSIILES